MRPPRPDDCPLAPQGASVLGRPVSEAGFLRDEVGPLGHHAATRALSASQSPSVTRLKGNKILSPGRSGSPSVRGRTPRAIQVQAGEHFESTVERLMQDLAAQYAQLRDEVIDLRARNTDLTWQLGERRAEQVSSPATAGVGEGRQVGEGDNLENETPLPTTKGCGTVPEEERPYTPASSPTRGKGLARATTTGTTGTIGRFFAGRNIHLHGQVTKQFQKLQAKGVNDHGLFPIPHARWIKSQLKIIRHDNFDLIFAIIILLHAVFLGVQYNFRVSRAIHNSTTGERIALWPGWIVGDIAFSTVFSCEVILRIFAYQMRFFTGSPRYWNMFDLFCIIGGVIATVLDAMEARPSIILTVLRVCRLARLIRTLRVSKWSGLHNLKMLCYTVVGSFNAFVSAVVLLFVDQYIFGLVFMQGVEQYLANSTDVDEDAREKLVGFFGNLSQTFWTLSAAITGGKDWEEAALSLLVVSDLYHLMFGIYVIFTYLCVLNILNGVFVSVAMESAQTRRDVAQDLVRNQTRSMIDQISRWFVDADKDKSNRVSKSELHELLSDANIRDHLLACNIDVHSADKIFALLDTDGDGEVKPEEFVTNLMSLRGEAKSVDLAHLSLLCENMDKKINKLIKGSTEIVRPTIPRGRENAISASSPKATIL